MIFFQNLIYTKKNKKNKNKIKYIYIYIHIIIHSKQGIFMVLYLLILTTSKCTITQNLLAIIINARHP